MHKIFTVGPDHLLPSIPPSTRSAPPASAGRAREPRHVIRSYLLVAGMGPVSCGRRRLVTIRSVASNVRSRGTSGPMKRFLACGLALAFALFAVAAFARDTGGADRRTVAGGLRGAQAGEDRGRRARLGRARRVSRWGGAITPRADGGLRGGAHDLGRARARGTPPAGRCRRADASRRQIGGSGWHRAGGPRHEKSLPRHEPRGVCRPGQHGRRPRGDGYAGLRLQGLQDAAWPDALRGGERDPGWRAERVRHQKQPPS